MANDSDEELLGRNIVDVQDAEAATIARENARGAASPGSRRKQSLGSRVLGNHPAGSKPL